MDKTPLYYFCEKAKIQFIKEFEYQLLPSEEKQKYKQATFQDVRLYGSDELKKEIEPYKQASMQRAMMFGSLK
jgi:hypothetical protein